MAAKKTPAKVKPSPVAPPTTVVPHRAPVKKALLVGINKFKYVSGLQGCVNDTINVRDILTSFFGFTVGNIHQLLDSAATKANIIGELQWLVRDTIVGDTLVFHFSSHGSQIPDKSGDEATDHRDEILCCHDMNWETGGYIIDDDLLSFAKQIPNGVKVEVLFDTCHSGTAHSITPRELTHASNDPTSRNLRPVIDRFLPPPPHIMEVLEELDTTHQVARGLTPVNENRELVSGTQALWSGCGEGQTSADAFIGGKYNGAFTYYWCQTIRLTKGSISRNTLLKKIRENIGAAKYAQIPELTSSVAYSEGLLI